MWRRRNGSEEYAAVLLDLGANVNVRSLDGDPALLLAVAGKSRLNIVRLLVDRGTDVCATAADGGDGVLHVAANVGTLPAFEYLCSLKAVDVTLRRPSDRANAEDIARRRGQAPSTPRMHCDAPTVSAIA
jgi:ankyrin repeat protein